MLDDLWLRFEKTGKIEDYMKYKQNENASSNANLENEEIDEIIKSKGNSN